MNVYRLVELVIFAAFGAATTLLGTVSAGAALVFAASAVVGAVVFAGIDQR